MGRERARGAAVRRLVLLLLAGAAPALAQEAPDAARARLEALAERERHLAALVERLAAEPAASTSTTTTSAASPAAGPAVAPAPGAGADGELLFERARLAALRARAEEGHPADGEATHEPAHEPGREAAPAHDEAPSPHPEAPASAHDEAHAPSPAEAPASPHTPARRAPPVQLAEGLLAAGDAAGALEAFRAAADEAEAHGDAAGAVRARYGAARALERLGRLDEALPAYAAVEGAPEAGPWAAAARFARGFIAWRRRLGEVAAPRGNP